MNVFVPISSPLQPPWGVATFVAAYICQTANPEESASYGASKPSPQCASTPLLFNSLVCSGTLQSLALMFPFLLAQGGLLCCVYLHLAQFLLLHLAHCLHLVGSQ